MSLFKSEKLNNQKLHTNTHTQSKKESQASRNSTIPKSIGPPINYSYYNKSSYSERCHGIMLKSKYRNSSMSSIGSITLSKTRYNGNQFNHRLIDTKKS